MKSIGSFKSSMHTTCNKLQFPICEIEGVEIYRCYTTEEIQEVVEQIFNSNIDILPRSKEALIFLKPNLNSDMCGLTGNTTDLRILFSVMTFMKNNGYRNVVIGDGTSTGFINTGINVISRLKIDRLAHDFGFRVLDLNKAEAKIVRLDEGTEVKIAKICFDTDLFVNLPKIKTHAEAGVSICLKNMIGCVVGVEKQKIHRNLYSNIIKLNEIIRPDFHIADGLIAMEGTGPSRGKPVKMGLLVSGRKPWSVDYVCTRLMGFIPDKTSYLQTTEKNGNIEILQRINNSPILAELSRKFQSPEISLGSLINSPKYRGYFAKLRYNRALFKFFSLDLVSKFLYLIKARQDLFVKQDSSISNVLLDKSKCNDCHLCLDYCPINLRSYDEIGKNRKCLHCLYCYFACSKNAISLEGSLGYLKYQMTNYVPLIRKQVLKQADTVNKN